MLAFTSRAKARNPTQMRILAICNGRGPKRLSRSVTTKWVDDSNSLEETRKRAKVAPPKSAPKPEVTPQVEETDEEVNILD